jgi:hypothetical protein
MNMIFYFFIVYGQ